MKNLSIDQAASAKTLIHDEAQAQYGLKYFR